VPTYISQGVNATVYPNGTRVYNGSVLVINSLLCPNTSIPVDCNKTVNYLGIEIGSFDQNVGTDGLVGTTWLSNSSIDWTGGFVTKLVYFVVVTYLQILLLIQIFKYC
jgi:hypothetical protein